MNKSSLITFGKKLYGSDLFLLSVFDLEPSGVIVHAYNQIDSKEYTFPIAEYELASAGLTRKVDSLAQLLESIELVQIDGDLLLQTSYEGLSNPKLRIKSNNLANMMKEPLSAGSDSLNEVLVNGLVALCKAKPVGLDAVNWLGNWLLENNPAKPRVDIDAE